jgi:glutaconyl-CoA/methylmalonyl-CoA decarboxylase subunit gamma
VKLKGYLDDREHAIEVIPIEGGYRVSVDGVARNVDTAHIVSSFYSLLSDGKSYYVSVQEAAQGQYVVWHGGFARRIRIVNPLAVTAGATAASDGPMAVTAVMAGRVVKLLVSEGDEVRAGQPVVVLEAMKMENDIPAPKDGIVREIHVTPGQTVETAEKLLVVG